MSDSKRTNGEPKDQQAKKRAASGSKPVSMPAVKLQPARLVTRSALRKAEASQLLSAMRGSKKPQTGGREVLSPSGNEPPSLAKGPKPRQLLAKQVLARASKPAAPEKPAAAPAPQARPSYVTKKPSSQRTAPSFGYSADPKQKPPSEAQGWNELQAALSRTGRRLAPYVVRGTSAALCSVSGWLPRLNWKLAATAAAVVAVFVFVDRPMLQDTYAGVGAGVQPYVDQIKARAAFQIVDDFNSGVGDWWGNQGLVAEQPGAARVAGFSLHRETMDLVSYRMDFEAKIESRSVGWVVRAADGETYYAFKLLQSGRKNKKSYKLVRYPVVDGVPDETRRAEYDIPAELMEDDYNRVSMRTTESQLITFINGRSVDFWRDSGLNKGGVGFWVEKGESGLIRQLAVSGNEDFWGLTLYAAMETAQAVNHFIDSLISDPSEVASGLRKGVGDLGHDVKRMTPASWQN